MKQLKFLVILMLVTLVGKAQAPSNYTNINGRYRWIAGMFDSTFHIPKGTTPSLRTGGSTNAGALFYRTSDSTVRYWTGTQWLTLSDTTRFVPYVGAIKDVDLNSWSLNAKSLHIKGTAGNGHLGLKFQSATPNMSANESGVYADANGNLGVKIDNAYTSIFKIHLNSADRTYTFQNKNYTVADSADVEGKIGGTLISGYLTKATGTKTIDTSQIYQSSGLIGIGTTSPIQKLQVSGNAYVNGQLFAGDTALSVYQVEGILNTPYVLGRKAVDNTLSTEARPTGVLGHVVGRGSIANRLQGGAFYATTDSNSTANSTGSLRGATAWSSHNGSGSLATAWGGYNIVTNKTTGTITNAYGSVSGVENRGATSTINKLQGSTTEVWNNYGGTIDTAWGQVISIYNNNAASNIGAVYGLSIGRGLITPTGGTHFWRNLGTIGSSYGIYLDSAIDVGTNRYAIYSNSYSNSYLRANLGLGTSTPDSNLTVANGAYFQRGVRMSGLPTAPGTKALRINASGTISIADTLIDAGGTVTSVATNNGTGITGGTITTTGTIAADTLLLSTRAWRQKGIDSVAALANTKIGGSGTTNYIPKFTSSSAIGNSQVFDNGTNVGVNEATPSEGKLVINNPNGSTNNGVSGNTLFLKAQTANANLIRFSGAIATDLILGRFGNADNLSIGTTGGTTIATFTSSGNLGLGVTPSAWGTASNRVAIELSTGGSNVWAQNFGGSNPSIQVGSNVIETSGGAIYKVSAQASYYQQNAGNHAWYNAPSGTAGNAISFTQAMTLDASGRLGIGTSSPTKPLSVLSTVNDGAISSGGNLLTSGYFGNGGIVLGTVSTTGNGAIFNNSVKDILFGAWTGSTNAEYMRLTSGGELLINTTTDVGDYKLQVSGNVYASGSIQANTSVNAGTGIENASLNAGYLGFYNAAASNKWIKLSDDASTINAIGFSKSGSAATVWFPSGNVGIGTTNPGNILSIVANTNSGSGSTYPLTSISNTLATQGDGSSTFNFAGQLIQSGNGAVQFYQSTSYASGTWEPQALLNVATNHPLIIRTNNTERMRITSGGNVGIGSSSPVSANLNGALTIWKTYNSDGASVPSTTGQNYYGNQSSLYLFGRNSGITIIGANGENNDIKFANASTTQFATIGTLNGTTSAGGDMYFKVGSDAERMRIFSNGNVAIGTTTDAGYKLDVAGSIRGRQSIIDGANNANVAKLNWTRTDNSWSINNETNLRFYTGSGNTLSPATQVLELATSGAATFSSSITTGAPSGGTAKPWKLGEAGVTVGGANNTAVKVEIDGVVYYLLTAYLPEPAPEAAPKPKPEN